MTPKEKNEELEAMPPVTTWREAFLYWAMRQGILAVLILIGVGMIGWAGRYAVIEGIPSVVSQIKQGYADMEKSHREEREKSEAKTAATLDKLGTSIDRLIEKNEARK